MRNRGMGDYVSLQDLADYAGVAKSTVSLALRNDPKVKAATREHIRKCASDLGYRADPVVAALASRRWRGTGETVAIIGRVYESPYNGPANTGNDYITRVWRICGDYARGQGYAVDDFDVNDYPSAKALENVLAARNIRGVLVFPLFHWKAFYDCRFPHCAAVTVSPGPLELRLRGVRSHVAFNLRAAYRHALTAGYRRIGLLMPVSEGVGFTELDESALGALAFCQQYLAPSLEAIPPFTKPPASHRQELREWMEAQRIDCAIVWNTSYVDRLQEMGWEVPSDLALIAMKKLAADDGLAGFLCDPESHAKVAVDVLDREMRHNHLGIPEIPLTALLADEWHDGASLPAAT